ncbi:MAG TPA: nicotinate-nucleotide--dimethylbenzimidazole phosphoribosyltransferase [Thermodesulfobacteriaceae bacterium]|nr:nicotinate-nucleotide--dimethylbenzimidazole phosphoribosyltransferase [Thermodesulfobacteriaceae bacterium]
MGLLEKTVNKIDPADRSWRHRARERLNNLCMPHWALGCLMDLAVDLAGMTRSMQPPVAGKTIVTMAGDHGVVEEGVSLYPQEVTTQMVWNFVKGGAGINALAGQAGAKVAVVDMGVAGDLGDLVDQGLIFGKKIAPGTSNMTEGPAMDREQAVRALEAGIEVAEELGSDTDLFGTGDMGIGNTTPSAAICAALTGAPVEEVTGRGTGLDDVRLACKIAVVKRSVKANRPDSDDGLDVLAKLGGFEIGGIAGLILGAASQRKPVLVDGFISTAGAMIACTVAPAAKDYIIAAHRSVEPGHRRMQEYLGISPLLDLGMRLGEGTGAALAMNIVDAAVRILVDVATFSEAEVSRGMKAGD